jgi:hypothetical protein
MLGFVPQPNLQDRAIALSPSHCQSNIIMVPYLKLTHPIRLFHFYQTKSFGTMAGRIKQVRRTEAEDVCVFPEYI